MHLIRCLGSIESRYSVHAVMRDQPGGTHPYSVSKFLRCNDLRLPRAARVLIRETLVAESSQERA
jgi:hypothetical protein